MEMFVNCVVGVIVFIACGFATAVVVAAQYF